MLLNVNISQVLITANAENLANVGLMLDIGSIYRVGCDVAGGSVIMH